MFVAMIYRVAENKIPPQTICNFSANELDDSVDSGSLSRSLYHYSTVQYNINIISYDSRCDDDSSSI